jgi:hypothetical protein
MDPIQLLLSIFQRSLRFLDLEDNTYFIIAIFNEISD